MSDHICPACNLASDADPRDELDLHDLAHGHPVAEKELAELRKGSMTAHEKGRADGLREAAEVARSAKHSLPEDRSEDDALDKTARYSNSTCEIIARAILALAGESDTVPVAPMRSPPPQGKQGGATLPPPTGTTPAGAGIEEPAGTNPSPVVRPWTDFIEKVPGKCSGQAIFKGTRIMVVPIVRAFHERHDVTGLWPQIDSTRLGAALDYEEAHPEEFAEEPPGPYRAEGLVEAAQAVVSWADGKEPKSPGEQWAMLGVLAERVRRLRKALEAHRASRGGGA